MKIINLGRGQGKTIRLLYASEWNDIPILCATNAQKDYLLNQAEKLGLVIHEPIVADEITSNRIRGSKAANMDLLVDEAPLVLQSLLNSIGMMGEIKAATLTSDELK
jgi:hypothetical protein